MIIYSNCLGSFVFDNSLKLAERADCEKEAMLQKKHSAAKPSQEQLAKILEFFSDSQFNKGFRDANLALTKRKIMGSVNEDNLIIQAIGSLDDLNVICNLLSKRLREWFGLYNPEFEKKTLDNEAFVRHIAEGKEISDSSMGPELSGKNREEITGFAKHINTLYEERGSLTLYLEQIMKKYCLNLLTVAGATITAKLIAEAGSLARLASMSSSTLQLLGAEAALFRHLRTGAKPPKYGHIMQHQVIARAPADKKGKAARLLANKLSIAAKMDYFKGKFMGEELKKQIEEKLR